LNAWLSWRAGKDNMLQALADPILPIFAVLVAGFLMQRAGLFNHDHAQAINRFVFYIATPALIFMIIANAPYSAMNWPVLWRYLAAELATYIAVAALARLVFGRDIRESILLGMTASFANHVFFVRPISISIYGPSAADPISGIVLFDIIVFCATVFAMDIVGNTHAAPAQVIRSLARNPFVYAPILAAIFLALGDATPSGIATFADFTGAAASPASLFALGIVLASLNLRKISILIWVVVAGKLALLPLLFWLTSPMPPVTGVWNIVPLLVAAGPCGAMAFVIAMQYNVKTDLIAKAILISTILSVFSLSVLAQ
jgi:malonate transporter